MNVLKLLQSLTDATTKKMQYSKKKKKEKEKEKKGKGNTAF